MGLNWAAGLAGAASGMEGLVDLKQKEVGMLYDQVSQQNQFRHREQMQSNQQEFLTGEREAGEAWKLENEIPLKQKEIEQRGELAILQQESLDTQRSIENQLREQSNMIQQQRADTGEQRAVAENLEGQAQLDDKYLERVRQGVDDLKWNAPNTERIKANEKYRAAEAEVNITGDSLDEIKRKRKAFNQAYGMISDAITLPDILNVPKTASDAEKAQAAALNQKITAAYEDARKKAAAFAELPEAQQEEIKRKIYASDNKIGTFMEEMNKRSQNPLGALEQPAPEADKANATAAEQNKNDMMGPVTEEERKAAMFGGDRESRQAAQTDIMKRQGEWKKKVEERAKEIARRSGIDLNSISQKDQIYSRNETDSRTYNQLMAQAEAELKRENQDFIQSPQLAQK